MSYDLWFRAANGTAPGPEQVHQYFAGRPHYRMSEQQAWYENETTGVYFSFELSDESGQADEEEDEQQRDVLPVAFNINYFRPHVFGLEAEPELTAFVERFGLTVSDPQSDGMGDGAYSCEGFLRGYNAGNRFAHQAMLSMNETPALHTLPEAVIEVSQDQVLGAQLIAELQARS